MKNLKLALTLIVVGIFIWFGVDSFINLVMNVYHFLDGFIWAFFAGIIAFFVAIWLVIIMIYISVFSIIALIAIIVAVVRFFKK